MKKCLESTHYVEHHLPDVEPKWFPMNTESADASDIIPLLEDQQEYITVYKDLSRTLADVEIRRIYRVQNLKLWDRFSGSVISNPSCHLISVELLQKVIFVSDSLGSFQKLCYV